mmetsp:Transcript_85615/g.239105  ORF Transcript_85615/g.239105 Transcript_85615/m.239105 type:complete len:102 (+) Transcript_85615:64-369(+)|eukprot:CAMPEP_0117537414 /NCGR_PEP_ID=MMETSP0784-20121206/41950_1 /TAXON_ID=39447 /ORGANISM="" /LENGTH=101 /DNA_ID=CAMNT_0005333995 /DNA_START=46 /DNA_END=351 /DNA_ORIENTATION=+
MVDFKDMDLEQKKEYLKQHRVTLKTTPHDKKLFPATNQTHYCWQKYNEYVLCLRKNGGEEQPCYKQYQHAVSICPLEWMEAWNDQREAGNFLGVQERAAEH